MALLICVCFSGNFKTKCLLRTQLCLMSYNRETFEQQHFILGNSKEKKLKDEGKVDRSGDETRSLEILVTLPVKSDWNKSLKRKSYFPACYRGDAAWIKSFSQCTLPSIISLLSVTTCLYLYMHYILLKVCTGKALLVRLLLELPS